MLLCCYPMRASNPTQIQHTNEELKSLTRYRFDKVKERAKLKVLSPGWSAFCFRNWKNSSLLCILLLSTPCWKSSRGQTGCQYPFNEAESVARNRLNGHYKRDMALEIRNAAKTLLALRCLPSPLNCSTPSSSSVNWIVKLMKSKSKSNPLWMSFILYYHYPGLGFRMAAMILAEVGDFTRFDSPDKLLACGDVPSTYQSGQLKIATRIWKAWLPIPTLRTLQRNQVCLPLGPDFADYLAKKRAEENTTIAISPRGQKLVRLIFAMEVQAAILLSGLSAAT